MKEVRNRRHEFFSGGASPREKSRSDKADAIRKVLLLMNDVLEIFNILRWKNRDVHEEFLGDIRCVVEVSFYKRISTSNFIN